jgi:hypothetical protein
MTTALAAAMALAAASALSAQDAGWSKGSFGIHLGYMNPMAKMADRTEPGFGAALSYEKVYSGGFAARGRLEYAQLGEKKRGPFLYEDEWERDRYFISDQWTQIGAMLDVAYYHNLKGTLYPFAGLGYFARDAERTIPHGDSYISDINTPIPPKSEFGAYAGLGHYFSRHFGAELKYTLCSEGGWAQVSLLCRF